MLMIGFEPIPQVSEAAALLTVSKPYFILPTQALPFLFGMKLNS